MVNNLVAVAEHRIVRISGCGRVLKTTGERTAIGCIFGMFRRTGFDMSPMPCASHP